MIIPVPILIPIAQEPERVRVKHTCPTCSKLATVFMPNQSANIAFEDYRREEKIKYYDPGLMTL